MWQKVAKFKGAEYFRKALYVYAVFYTICCILPMLLGHRSSIYLYVHILIHPFTFVCIR